jgi:molybdopterin-guanine dinucleotide biosynthesis protein MobB
MGPELLHLPVFGICGFSGAGKTTLLLDLVRRLRARGLCTLVIKHDAHGLDVDRPGKDSQRLFAAGTDVLARDESQSFLRRHRNDSEALAVLVRESVQAYDVVLVEGHKSTPLPHKIWLRRHTRDRPPESCRPVQHDLGRDQDRGQLAWDWIDRTLARLHGAAPTFAGVLIGGQSRRMGRPKHLLQHQGRTWLARIVSVARETTDQVVLLGSGSVPRAYADLPRLADAAHGAGPVAGMVAAMRWNPAARWIFLACDTPRLTSEALAWLKGQAGPGVWMVQPRLSGGGLPEPLPGWYDYRARAALEGARGPSQLARHPRAASPIVPAHLTSAWLNCNTPAAVRRLKRDR